MRYMNRNICWQVCVVEIKLDSRVNQNFVKLILDDPLYIDLLMSMTKLGSRPKKASLFLGAKTPLGIAYKALNITKK